jgi:hypothetical protein
VVYPESITVCGGYDEKWRTMVMRLFEKSPEIDRTEVKKDRNVIFGRLGSRKS